MVAVHGESALICIGGYGVSEPEGRGRAVVGVSFYSPYVSTMRGMAGVYVSDLWTAEVVRGQGLGPRLLAETLRDAEAVWGARFLKLDVYHTNPDARRFYDRLGFRPADDLTKMILEEAESTALKGET